MRQTGMNTLYKKVSSVREQLILFASQMESLEQDYNTVVAELENSFVDSKNSGKELPLKRNPLLRKKPGLPWKDLNRWQMA